MIQAYRFLCTLALFFTITACDSSSSADNAGEVTKGLFDEDAARDDAAANLTGLTFQDVGDTTRCTEDCSGHNAGFKWAQDHEIQNSSDCGGNSQSFIEGCEEYGRKIEERVDEARNEAENGDE